MTAVQIPPTYGLVNEIYRTDLDRNLMVIPAYVFHAHQNIGNYRRFVCQYAHARLSAR